MERKAKEVKKEEIKNEDRRSVEQMNSKHVPIGKQSPVQFPERPTRALSLSLYLWLLLGNKLWRTFFASSETAKRQPNSLVDTNKTRESVS